MWKPVLKFEIPKRWFNDLSHVRNAVTFANEVLIFIAAPQQKKTSTRRRQCESALINV